MRLRFSLPVLVAAALACGHAEDFSDERPEPSRLVGLACDKDEDCEQHCSKKGEFPGGFCTIHNCRSNDDCPGGTVCIKIDAGVCVYPCSSPLDCTSEFLGRSGYTCRTASGYGTEETSRVLYWVCLKDD
ncbi:hypothetical protein ACFL6C_07315 [Myxococcota bacterium]